MRFYRVILTGAEDEQPLYRIQREQARVLALTAAVRAEARIELVEFVLGQHEILDLLNGDRSIANEADALETWALTDRGGLKEVPNGE